jgi:hypothetical protein
MIPQQCIKEWRVVTPWTTDAQIENVYQSSTQKSFLVNMNAKRSDTKDTRLIQKYANEAVWELREERINIIR